MTSTELPETRSAWVDEHLRAAILSGELAPGQRLVAATLAERWSVSATPLREAFQHLAAQGLVELTPQRGARVADVSPEDAEEVYELRLLLEPAALRDSLGHSDDEHRAEMHSAHAVYESSLRPGTDLGTMLDAHRAFHAAMLARCGNRRLLDLVDLLALHSQRYQVLSVRVPGGHHDVTAEHRRLIDAAVEGRVDDAVQELEAHLRATLDGYREGVRSSSRQGSP
jgi:DNA-binding GntR family transcriptional regulator